MKGGNDRPDKYTEASISVPRDIHDAVCNFIIENYAGGLVIEDSIHPDKIIIRFYLPNGGEIEYQKKLISYINSIAPGLNFKSSDINTSVIKNVSWEKEYRNSVKPTKIGPVLIRPPWFEKGNGSDIDIIIEPKMAFGTGTHETTRLCIKELLKLVKPDSSVLDVGCGSGILSILAARLNARRIKGLDIDRVAVNNARDNAIVNNVSNMIEIEQGSVEKARDDDQYDIAVANIIKNTILNLYADINALVKPGGFIILSGLLIEDQPAIVEMLADYNNIENHTIFRDGQWIAVTINKK